MNKEELLKLLVAHRPWEGEPNNVRFRCLGYHCEIKRHPEMLHLCGYINIPKSHPLYEVEEKEIDHFLSVYGGVTYEDKTSRFKRIGFDCAHAGDFSPGTYMVLAWIEMKDYGEVDVEKLQRINDPRNYKTVKWVADQLSNIACQLKTYETRYDTEQMMGTLKDALRSGKSPREELNKLKKEKGANNVRTT